MHASISPTRPLSLLCLPSTHGFDLLFHPRLIRVKKKRKKKRTTSTWRNLRPIIRRDERSPEPREERTRKRGSGSQSRRVKSNTG